MNPVFIFLVLVGAVILWFLLSALFYPFGRFLHRIWKDAADEINREENKEKDKSVQLSAKDAAFLNKLAGIMEEQLSNPELNVDQLVSYFSLSRTNFFHKLKSLTGMAPIMYIKEMRMRKAAELIKENQYTMSEIAYMVGFSDPHYFSKSFKSYWGMTSTEYAKNQIGR